MKKFFLLLSLLAIGQVKTYESISLKVFDRVTEATIGTAAGIYGFITLCSGFITVSLIRGYYYIQQEKENARLEGRDYRPGLHYFEIDTKDIAKQALATATTATSTYLLSRAFKQLVIQVESKNFMELSLKDQAVMALLVLASASQLYNIAMGLKETVLDIKNYQDAAACDYVNHEALQTDLKNHLKRNGLAIACSAGNAAMFLRAVQRLVKI